jgi:hypothetical protein
MNPAELVLPGRFEFLSDAWLDEARSYLESALERRKEAVAGQPFSLSEGFSDGPPHLGLPGDVAAWTCRFDGKRLSVTRGFDAAADRTIEGDYQAALVGAQWVGIQAPGSAAALGRELRTLFGADAFKVKGGALPPAAEEIFQGLHDHLGRRTMENPDLAHRAARLGLTGHIRELEEQGYTVIERAISDGFADEVRAATIRAMSEQQSISLQWMLYHGREFEQLVQNPKLMTLIDASLGRGAVIASLSAVRRGPGPGFIPIHTDYAHVPEPYPEFSMTGVGVWALEDWTVASGPTWIVPGSHRMRRGPRPGEGQNGGVPIEMPKGSVVYFAYGVWHWQGERSDPGERITLHNHFNRGILRGLEPKKVDVQMIHRNPPRLAEMLGEDDGLDKLSAAGRDHLRLAYMGRLLAFTEQQKRKVLAEA